MAIAFVLSQDAISTSIDQDSFGSAIKLTISLGPACALNYRATEQSENVL
jgi:hypothetical protein